MKKMLYMMNTDWNWIKQRPHFLAEELSLYYELVALYPFFYRRKGYQKRHDTSLNLKRMYSVPIINRFARLREINGYIHKRRFNQYCRRLNPDYIFLTYPRQIELIPENCNAKIVYDCMDNHEAFPFVQRERDTIKSDERRLCEVSENILVTSEYLKNHIINDYGKDMKSKITVIRNGYDGIVMDLSEDIKPVSKAPFKLCYFGTISTWFDFEIVKSCIQTIPNIEFHLFGPIDSVSIPNDDRIIYHGTIEHKDLFDTTRNMDVFIMPFVINDVVKAVDPVKLYEYINFYKNIIVVDYKEINRFKPFVYTYNNNEQFMQVVDNLIKNNVPKYSNAERIAFLRDNSWSERAKQIVQAIS